MPWLCIERYNDREFVSLLYFEPKVEKEAQANYRFIELSDADAELGLQTLTEYYRGGMWTRNKPKAPIVEPTKVAEMLSRMVAIVKTSHFEGERQTARDFYKKLSGKDCPE